MRGGRKQAKLACGRPLDGRVRPLAQHDGSASRRRCRSASLSARLPCVFQRSLSVEPEKKSVASPEVAINETRSSGPGRVVMPHDCHPVETSAKPARTRAMASGLLTEVSVDCGGNAWLDMHTTSTRAICSAAGTRTCIEWGAFDRAHACRPKATNRMAMR